MIKKIIKAGIGFYLIVLFSETTYAQLPADTFGYKTLAPVSVYTLKSRVNNKNIRLTSSEWVQHDAGQVLSQISGFGTIRKSGAFAFDPVFRGFKLEQLNIINDGGVTAHAACPNRMDPPTSQIMINQVEEIEILKGPHNFRFGPSSGAVINFKTADPQFTEKSTVYGRLNAGHESNGNIRRTEGMWGIRKKKFQLSLAGSYSKGQDYRDGNDSIISAFFSRGALNMALSYKVTDKQTASINVTRNFARNVSFPVLMMDLLNDDTWLVQGKYAVKSSGKIFNQWVTQVYTSVVDHQMGNALRPTAASMLSHVFANTQTSGARTEFVVKRSAFQFFTGVDFKYEFANGIRTRSMLTGPMAGRLFSDSLWQQGSNLRTGIFAHANKKWGRNELSVSSRADVVKSIPQQVANRYKLTYDHLVSTDINPSLSIGFVRSLSKNWLAGAWLGRGVRSASITEKFINFLPVGMDAYEVIGNPSLKPEANTQLDLMIQFKKEKTLLQVSAYASTINNFISSVILSGVKPVVASAPGVRQYVNIDKANLAGFELTWNQQVGVHFSNELTAFYTRGRNPLNDQPLPEITPFEIKNKIQGKFMNNKLSPYVTYRNAFKQDRISADFGEKKTPSFTVVDLGMRVVLMKNTQITFVAQNIFDVAYREHLSRYIRPTLPLNSPGRSIVVMASWEF